MKFRNTSYLVVLLLTFFVSTSLFAQEKKKDSTASKKDTTKLKYNFKHAQNGGLFLKDPAKTTIYFDKVLNKYVMIEKIGDYYVRTPIFMTPKEFKEYRLKRDMLNYYKEKVSAQNGKSKGSLDAQKNLLPKYYVNSKFFETIFGGNTVEVIPSGRLNLKLGVIYQKTDDPRLSENNRSSFTFDFDQQISANIIAKVGKRLKVTANYDTQTTFDFQNIIKLEYTPTEDDIIRKIDAGNINMPIKNSLINGAQSLFGVKTELQFGKTKVTAVFSQQNSESKTINVPSAGAVEPFELRATDYDNDRHFFLAQYFRENYKNALKKYPLISSPINITRVEVWVTNTNASTQDFRSIVAFADIGESKINDMVKPTIPLKAGIPTVNGNNLPTNGVNDIEDWLNAPTGGIRDISTVPTTVSTFGMQQGTDYSLLQNARKLQPNEYTLHPQLGFISLNRRLNDGEVLAVAYEYTVVGASNGEQSFKVGEFSNDGIEAPNNLAVKLLRSEIITTKVAGTDLPFPTWRLMMKNIYALGAYPLEQDGFRFEIQYRDDATGVPTNTLQEAVDVDVKTKPLLNIFNLDRLDQSQFEVPNGDGFFDFVEGATVNTQNGYVIFPEAEPFGINSTLSEKLVIQADKDKYLFEQLYTNTKAQAKNNFQEKDKFFLKGYFKSDGGDGIPLNAFNVPRGSVKVTAGGRQLVEGVDFVVDYLAGRVKITDPGLKASGVPIQVSTENNAVFNQQRKTFMGIDVEHRFSEDFVIGGTILNVNERPITPKVNFGQEPINNTMFGFNLDYSTEMPIFTKWVNKLPFVDTDAPSSLSVRADMAYLLPGTPSGIDVRGAATSYIDDFEASQIPIDLLSPLSWYTASTPSNSNANLGGENNDLTYNDKRAKLAWYSIDQIFYGAGNKPGNIDVAELSRPEVRQISFNELFPQQQLDITQNALVRTLDLAYFPSERGPYNFDTTNASGTTLNDPETRWGGIMRPLTTNNFDQANVEYIQFWVKDPYENYSITNAEGLPAGVNPNDITNQVGELHFNLGNISEDILKDNRKQYENGLPALGGNTNTISTLWGKIPSNPSILYAFDADDAARTNQDVGLDGLTDDEERAMFPALASLEDPASDNFQYYRGAALDNADASIITRYKNFNNTQGNSPTANQSNEPFPTSSTSYPDVEDINKDQTMNTIESYYEYKVSLNKTDLVKGRNFIVDEKEQQVTLEDGSTRIAKWYQFRIPVRSGTPVNGISDFNSIRFIRMFMTKFKMPVVLRFGQLELVRGDWRRYTRTLDPAVDPQQDLDNTQLNNFEVGVVNLEQNEDRYQLPPGILREELQGTTTVQQQNEQSVSLKVKDLPQDKIRAIYKNISADLRMYKQLEMFLHAEALVTGGVSDDELVAIIRLGTDLNDNFYQIEMPLKVSTKLINPTPLEVWPEANNLKTALEALGRLKLERDGEIIANNPTVAINKLYSAAPDTNGLVIGVKGSPTLAAIRTLMLGVKNTSTNLKSGEIWFNELRSSGFENKGGWAAVVSADAKFADVADVSLTGRIQTIGFGNVEDRVQQRSLEETKQYDVATNINLGKMMPKKWNINLPMNYSYGEEFRDPKFDPKYQDVKFAEAKEINPNSANAQDYTRRKSISFINVKKNRNPESKKKPRFYDVENVSVSYAFNEEYHKDYNIQKYVNQNVTTSASYNFAPKSKPFEPFKKSKFFNKSKYWQLIKDLNFNPVPKTIGINSRINRNYNEQQSRNLVEGFSAQPKLTQRRFLFDWDYNVAFDFTKSLQVSFNATNSYIYDNDNEDLQIFDKFFAVGRPNRYNQKLAADYKLPIDKIPFLNFVKADYRYTADFDWQASAKSVVAEVGNLIQNANTHTLNTNVNFARFYKNVGLEKLFLPKNKNAANKVQSKLPGVPTSRNVVQPKKKKTVGQKLAKGFYDVITSVKTAKVSYSENNGTALPGFSEDFGFLGGPTFGFAFGSQVDIRNKALENGWLVSPRADGDEYFNKTFIRTHYNKLDYNISVKPIKDLNIDFRANRIRTRDISQQLDIKTDPNNLNGQIDFTIPEFETGNFSTSYYMMSTAFKNPEALFQSFKANREIIKDRLAANSGRDRNKFGAQEVLIPAFLSAYSGSNASSTGLKPFKNIPIPNWTLRYNGLMKLKWFKKNFSSFTLTHGYKSSYSISNYTNNLQYDPTNLNKENSAGLYEPELLISSVSLIDEFSPLIKVDMKMRNSFSFRGEIRKDRALTLNLNNSTLTDIKGTEFVFGLGYRIKDVAFSTRFTGKKQKLKGDINLRADVTFRDNITVIRAIDEDNNQVTGGEKLFSLKLAADYQLNSNLTASFYYNHNTSRYAISTTFPRQAINAGLNIIYNLGN